MDEEYDQITHILLLEQIKLRDWNSEANLATHEEDWKKEFYERSLVLFWLYKQVNFSVTNLAFDSQTGYRGAIE
ncbi:hypothetical protein KIN20_027054 [Parelaphostrongylus tenuis]|uniref:Uncharacterized protein n=1 Tax=Parelaphostrongylus tenuis TaxID=148309 RepID=A0AAD5QZ41_PARTN|nr:hypothetical protein KIN20_027054 [Parelaphostrongylus tenuis]